MTEPTPEAYTIAFAAAFPGLPHGLSLTEAGRRTRAAIDAVWPLAEAQVRAKVAAEIRQYAQDEIRLQSSWLWHRLGESMLEEVAERFAARVAAGPLGFGDPVWKPLTAGPTFVRPTPTVDAHRSGEVDGG